MTAQLSVKTAVCSAYERLLEECQRALNIWNEQRAEIHESGLRGKQVDDELRKLQATYAKAYARLRTHVRDCETCQWVSEMERRSSECDSRVVSEDPENRLSA
jgi:hypothetical protein